MSYKYQLYDTLTQFLTDFGLLKTFIEVETVIITQKSKIAFILGEVFRCSFI